MGDTKNGRERKGLGKQSQRDAAEVERELRSLDDRPPEPSADEADDADDEDGDGDGRPDPA
jgi:hypothetical protein